MEQTTVTGFFPVVKSSNSSFCSLPAKRRKVEGVTQNADQRSKTRSRIARCMKERSTKRSRKHGEMTVSALLSAEPLQLGSETTSFSDSHSRHKRKSNMKLEKKQMEEQNSVPIRCPMLDSEQDSGKLSDIIKIDPWISEQAKLVLAMGRGCAAVNVSHKKVDLVHKNLVKASDVLEKGSSAEEKGNKTNVREEYLKKYQANIESASKKSRLKEKFSHLLDDKGATTKTSHSSESSADTQLSSTLRIPAHQRFKHLVSRRAEKSFVLPQKYKLLLNIFRTVDSVLFLLHRRSETCTFERLKDSVQSMLGRKFTEKHLAQLKTVLPSGFIFRIEKNLRGLNGMPSKQQLTIDANFEEASSDHSGSKSDLKHTVLITRKHMFESSLIEITKKHHQKYLKKLNLKISDNELQRWHPHFKLEEVPDIEEALLPQAAATKTVTSARDVLQRSQSVPQVEKALRSVAEKSTLEQQPAKLDPTSGDSNEQHSSQSTKPEGILKGVSLSLLERIKEKEKKKLELAMLRDPKQERRLALMDKLPDVVRIIKTFFISEKKAAIPIEDCVTKISQSHGTSAASGDIEDQIRLLHELAPDWLSIITVRKCPYVKISRTLDINLVLQKLQSIKVQESNK